MALWRLDERRPSATERIDDAKYWENRYKGYRFIEAHAAFNEYNGHWYLSVIMFKKDTEVMRK